MSRLQALLAKIGGKDAIDATPYLISNAGKNVRHAQGGEYGIRWKVASDASATSFSPLASSDCPDEYARLEREAIQAEPPLGDDPGDVPGFDGVEPVTMQERRAINTRIYGWVYPQERQA
jgi:hypothetical protein